MYNTEAVEVLYTLKYLLDNSTGIFLRVVALGNDAIKELTTSYSTSALHKTNVQGYHKLMAS